MGRKRMIELAAFEASNYLDNEEVIAEYLGAALEDPDPDAALDVQLAIKPAGVRARRQRA